MELINTKKEIPDEFYVFVNLHNFQTRQNIEKTGCIYSSAFLQYINKVDKKFASQYLKNTIIAFDPLANNSENFPERYLNGTINYLPFTYNANYELGFVSMFSHYITGDYQIEYNCELFRQNNFPLYPSRFSSCYAFGDYSSCIEVSKKYGWNINSVRKFKLIPHDQNRVAKVNMEIISLMRYANKISSNDIETLKLVWSSYWQGIGEIELELPTYSSREKYGSGLIWEYLIEGILKQID